MGVRKDIEDKDAIDLYKDVKKTNYDPDMPKEMRKGLKRFVDVKEAIGDLPPVAPGQDGSTISFNYPCDNEFLRRIGSAGVHPLIIVMHSLLPQSSRSRSCFLQVFLVQVRAA